MAGSANGSREPSAGPSRLAATKPTTYAPSSFTPLPRSLLSGADLRFSPTPPPESEKSLAEGAQSAPLTDQDRAEVDTKPTESSSGRTAVGGDIFIDEVPQKAASPLPDTVNEETNQHFEPPGLFSTSLMPTASSTTEGVVVDLSRPHLDASKETQTPNRRDEQETGKSKGLIGEKETKEDVGTDAEAGLLLPSHVLMDSTTPHKKHQSDGEGGSDLDEDDPMEGVHFVDDDISRGSKRYFDLDEGPVEVEATFLATADQSKICQNCKRPGHRSKDCKHVICTTCGAEDDHERRDCPVGLVCFGCGNRGHRKQDCPDPTSRMSRRTGCDRCGSMDHLENTCHTLWRVYSYRSTDVRSDVQREKQEAEGWEKEATGGHPADEWCYNCGREGHLGDDCQKRRGSLARLTVPSAFSRAMSSRGPFFLSQPSRSSSTRHTDLPPPTHSRFDDDDGQDDYDSLPFISGSSYSKFGGSNAGRKSREKEKSKQMSLAARNRDDEDDGWFDGGGRSSGMSIRGRGGALGGRGGRGGAFSTPNPNKGDYGANESGGVRGRRPWDSEYRERTPRDVRDRDRDRDRERSRSPPSRSDRNGGRDGNSDRSRNGDRDGMPFSHGHLMSPSIRGRDRDRAPPSAPNSAPAKVISFGKLSAPGSNQHSKSNDSPAVKGAKSLLNRALGNAAAANMTGTPTLRGKKSNNSNAGGQDAAPLTGTPTMKSKGKSKSLSASASASTSTPTSRSGSVSVSEREQNNGDSNGGAGAGSGGRKNRKKKNKSNSNSNLNEGERDWESEWRASGKGGGKVENWGKEMGLDKEEKSTNSRFNAGADFISLRSGADAGGGGGGGGGLKIKGRGASGGGVGNGGNTSQNNGPNTNANGSGKKKNSGQKYHGGYM